MSINDKELYPLKLKDRPEPRIIKKAIAAGLFRTDKYHSAEYKSHGIQQPPLSQIDFYYDQYGNRIQPFRDGLQLLEDYVETKLPNMFDHSFDYNKPIGVVLLTHAVKDKNGNIDFDKSSYRVIVGTHRTAFYKSIDLECMAYEVIEADDMNLGIIGLGSNIEIPKGIEGKGGSTVVYVAQMIRKRKLIKSKKAIAEYIDKIMPNAHGNNKNKIIKECMTAAKVQSQITSLTAKAIERLHEKYKKTWGKYTLEMKYNDKLNKYGTTFTKDYADNTFFDAIVKFVQSEIGTQANVYVTDKFMKEENPWLSRAQIVNEYNLALERFNKLLDYARKNPNLKMEDIISLGVIYPQIAQHNTLDEELPNEEIPLNHPLLLKELKTIQKKALKKKLKTAKGIKKSNVGQQQVSETLNEVLSMNLENFIK